MPSLISDAFTYFIHQQHQLAVTTSTRQLYNYLIPTLINDRAISESLLFFYLQKIPPFTICYINKICIMIQHGYYYEKAVAVESEPQQHSPESPTIAGAVDLFHLIVHGHLRHLTFSGSSDSYPARFEGFFEHEDDDEEENVNEEQQQQNPRSRTFGRRRRRAFLFSHSKLRKCITSLRVGLVELRFVSLIFGSEFEFGKIISLLACENATTRRSLEILQFLGCTFSSASRPSDDEILLCHQKTCFLPGMNKKEDLQNLKGLLELEVSDLPFYKSAIASNSHQHQHQQLCGYFCFEMLPPYLEKLTLAKSGENKTFVLHPSFETLDWENVPGGLIELNLNGAAPSLLVTSSDVLLANNADFSMPTNHQSTNERKNKIFKKRIEFENFPRSLQILKASQSAFDGPLVFHNNHHLREIILMSNSFLCGPLDFTKLPPQLEILAVSRCPGLGRNNERSSGDETDSKTHHAVVDLTQLPKNLKCLRIDSCNFSNQGENSFTPLDLTKLPSTLEILSLAQNEFVGELDLKHLPPAMTTLNLNFNKFSGEVNLRHLPKSMTFVDISHNKFSGYRMRREDVEAINAGTGLLKVLARGM